MADEKIFINIIAVLLILFGIFMIIRFIFGVFDEQFGLFKFIYLLIIYAFFSIFAFVNAYGLLKLRKWARKSVFVLSIIFILFLILLTTFDTINVIWGIFFLLTIFYVNFTEDVKKLFDKRK